MNMKIYTSNINKLNEFKRFGLDLEMVKGKDLDEVDGTPHEVITYKALDAGEGNLVEDTILIIDGKEVVDIREKMSQLDSFVGKKASWMVSLGCVIDDNLHTASAVVEGILKKPEVMPENAFGFDPYFFPVDCNEGYSLAELEEMGLKDDYSARKVAVYVFLNRTVGFLSTPINIIPKWKGGYQNITK